MARVEALCAPLGHQVEAIVNYDKTAIYPEVEEFWAHAVKALEDRYYRTTTRYSASAFMRMKLGKVLAREPGVQEAMF